MSLLHPDSGRCRGRIDRGTSAAGIFFICCGMMLGLFSCSSARMSDHKIDDLFREGKYEESAARLQAGLKDQGENSRDGLLFLLDLGLAHHSAGQYKESIQAFLRADKIAEIKDYTSLATESATLLTSDNIRDYKGEDFEKVLISTYLAMDYALLGNHEDALVEARRVNHKLYMMVSQGGRKYHQSAFARYLSAMLYEANGDANNAYIDYKAVYELMPSFPGLGRDLWRTASESEIEQDMEKWDETFQLTDADHKAAQSAAPASGNGEIIILYQNGISPIKRPHPSFGEIPKFYPRPNPVSHAEIQVAPVQPQGTADWLPEGSTAILDDIEKAAIENLDEKYAGIIARKVGGVVAKELVGYEVAKQTNSPILGALTKLALYASDQADVRSWNLLPRDLQVARIVVAPGTYRVRALPVGAQPCPDKTIQVGAGKKVFVTFRYMP